MKKTVKWVAIIVGGLVGIIILALLIAPMFIDVQKYKPEIEKFAGDAIGRPLTIGGNLSLSLFPWAGLSFSDLRIANASGFQEKDFVVIKSFDVSVKLLPLLSKEVQVKRFVADGLRLVLEKRKDGRGNWEGLGASSGRDSKEPAKTVKKPGAAGPSQGLPIKSLAVGEFALTNASILWIDAPQAKRNEISTVSLRLQDLSLDRPIRLAFSASLDNRPLAVEGSIGPLGTEPGKGTIPLNLAIKALNQLDMALKGTISAPATAMTFDLSVHIANFSPRKLMAAIGQALPVEPADPKVLTKAAFTAKLKGNPANITISDGALEMDDSKLSFSLAAKDFAKPDVAFKLDLDAIDVDRYLPPPDEKKPAADKKTTPAPEAADKKTDYAPLRKLVLDGSVGIGTLKVKGMTLREIRLKITGRNGLFNLDPLAMKLYQGEMSLKGGFDVRGNAPRSQLKLAAGGIQAGPLVKDFMKKDFIEGTLKSSVDIRMEGDSAAVVKRTLNGQGDLLFKDGAIVGIDLAGMVRNTAAAFGLAEKTQEKPKTDFAELHAPFTLTDGLVKTPDTTLVSPLLRVAAKGSADLVKESVDFRVEPKFVGTLKGQGDTTARSGIMVPVIVSGTFNAPKFRPDLEGLLKQRIDKELPKASELIKDLGTPGAKPDEIEKKAKDIFKGLPFGK